MKRLTLIALAAVALATACGDSPFEPGNVLKPQFDDIGNNIDATLDAVAEVMPLTLGGASGSTQLYVTPRNGDGKNGCNLTGSTTLVVATASSSSAVATVTPTSVTFASCGDIKALTITPVGQGTATISLSLTSNNTGGTFDLGTAEFTVNVAPPPNTAPAVVITGVTAGGAYSKGTLPVAMCQVTDSEDGPSSFAATLSAITGPYASDGIGSQTASCAYTDAGSLTASASLSYSIVDASAPTILAVLNPAAADGNNGWYRSGVTLNWSVTEAESPNSLAKTGCVDQNITADQAETAYGCSATSAGGSAGPVSVSIKRDATAPAASASRSPAANANGWNNGNVTVSFSGTDGLSGIASCAADQVLTTEGANQSGSGTCTDNAGNVSAAASVTGINIDKTAPSGLNFVGSIANGQAFVFGSVPAAPTCQANDALSGMESCVVSGYQTTVGTHTLNATATDKAGNTSTATVSYTVDPWDLNGFFQPIGEANTYPNTTQTSVTWNTVKGGSTVPLKFEIFRGLTESTDVADVFSFTTTVIPCDNVGSVGEDPVEVTTTGGTSLRFDPVASQFIQNWQTKKSNVQTCYRVVLTTDDGSMLVSYFKVKP